MPHATGHGSASNRSNEPLAIVGMACTLAGGVDSASTFWETLINKEIKQSARVPESRFNIDAYFHDDAFGRPSAIGSKGGYFLDTDLHAFDAEFFGYEADEAKHMDAQHFRILESVYECLESAGRTMEDVRGTNTAVYIGNFSLDQVIKSGRHSYDDRHLHEVIGVDPGLLSSRVSYCFDLSGPVFTTNTGCTSSLFALHTAALALRGGECTSAIVGGVNLLQGPEAYSSYSKFGIMSPDSMCHSYDARCNGYCRAEGVGSLYVRLLSDAIRDGDPIRGVVRAMAVNANGTVPGMPLFVPNQNGLEKSLRLAYAQADLDPAETAFVETHGIGMVLGEIAEAHAVGKAMNDPKRRESPVLVGSLKPNFGHQEAASGIFVLMKAAMMTEAGIIPGHTGFRSAHPAIDLEKLNIKPQAETIPWPEAFPKRRVGLCSYGWSGTNAHGIVESVQTLHPEYRLGQTREHAGYDHSSKRPLLLTFSAFKQSSLSKNIDRLQGVADRYYAADLAYTLNQRRSTFAHRAFAIATEGAVGEALQQSAITYGSVLEKDQQPKIVFILGELPSTLSEFLDTFPQFADAVKKLDDIHTKSGMTANLEASIRSGSVPSDSHKTALQLALVDLLAAWNIHPSIPPTNPSTDPAAAYASGLLSAEEALALPSLSSPPPPSSPSQSVLSLDATLTPLSLLHSAGNLWLQGHPISLSDINSLSPSSSAPSPPPSFLPSLPPYQWDHSTSYSSETHANLEHRLNRHPYHDLLGRRVHGLSPQTMIWKNKLSFRDLPRSIPWVPNEKPATVRGPAEFISMVAEALGQGFEGRGVGECVIRDLVVHGYLRYSEDCDLIELQTSVSRIPGEGGWRVGVEAVREGVWTTYCEGRVGVGRGEGGAGEGVGEGLVFDPKEVVPEALGCRYLLHPAIVETALRQVVGEKAIIEIGEVRVLASMDESVGKFSARVFSGRDVVVTDEKEREVLVVKGVKV